MAPNATEGTRGAPEVSVVVPVFRMADGLPALVEALHRYLEPRFASFELIVVDDGSEDHSAQVLHALGARWPALVALRLEANRGQSTAVYAGLRVARGRFLLSLDADLETGLEIIPRMVEALRGGAELVCGRRHHRRLPRFRQLGSALINRALRRWAAGCSVEDELGPGAVHDFGCGSNGGTQALFERVQRLPGAPRALKLALLAESRSTVELDVDLRQVGPPGEVPGALARPGRPSAYGLWRLLRLCQDLGIFLWRPHHPAPPAVARPVETQPAGALREPLRGAPPPPASAG